MELGKIVIAGSFERRIRGCGTNVQHSVRRMGKEGLCVLHCDIHTLPKDETRSTGRLLASGDVVGVSPLTSAAVTSGHGGQHHFIHPALDAQCQAGRTFALV